MEATLTLNSVTKSFQDWRTHRGADKLTPIVLQQQAVALQAHYTNTEIINALGINHSSLKRWGQQVGENHFVALPRIEPSIAVVPLTIILHNVQGCRLELTGTLTQNYLCALVQSFVMPGAA